MGDIRVINQRTHQEVKFLAGRGGRAVRERVFTAFGPGHLEDTDGITITDEDQDLRAGTYAFYPGRVQDAALTDFLHALKGARVKDLGQGMQLVSFGPGSHFPEDTHLRRSDFVVRGFYGALFELVASRRASLLTGVPGTGKSWWIWFAVHRLLNQDNAPAIVWQTFKRDPAQCVLFKGGKAFVGPQSAFLGELADESTWFFVDGMLPVWVLARTVMVCFPKRELYKEWIKGRDHIALTMPLWTWPEMEVLWRELYQGKVKLERAKRNFELWYGGVPRHVLEVPSLKNQDLPEDSAAALAAIGQARIEQVFDAVVQYDAGPDASHRVVHQDGDRKTFCALSTKFATMHVGVQFARRAQERGRLGQLMILLADPYIVNSSSRGHFFEALGHSIIRSGGRVEYKLLDIPCNVPAEGKAGRPTKEEEQTAMKEALDAATTEAAKAAGQASDKLLTLSLDSLQEQLFVAGGPDGEGAFKAAVESCTSGARYLRPDGPAHPIFDACICPDTLLRFTVSKQEGPLDADALEKYLQCLPPCPRYYLDYVVPADVYPNFAAAPLRRGSLPRVGKTYVRVVKIEAALPRSTQAKRIVQAKRLLPAARTFARLLPAARTFARSAHPAVRCWA